jgi:hypothetical protein
MSALYKAVRCPKKTIVDMLQDTYHIALICEVCHCLPDDGDENLWYEVRDPKEIAGHILPLARVGLGLVNDLNRLSSLGRLFGFPTPVLPDSAIEAGREFLTELGQGSLSEFTELLKLAETRQKDPQNETPTSDSDSSPLSMGGMGFCIREFSRFLNEKDPGHIWANLSPRVNEKGDLCYACRACCSK